MPPKYRAGRKGSIVSKDTPAPAPTSAKSMAMLPPPDPSPPARILEGEVSALSRCFKNAVMKTAQIYGFYSDTHKLGIKRYAPRPPRSSTASLGREMEKYDQLCDAIESHLVRAIAVLERDLAREERRIQDAKTAAISTRTRSKSFSSSPSSTRTPLPQVDTVVTGATQPTVTSETSAPAVAFPLGRRMSAISLSSLQRPPIPLTLDLSSTALRMTSEEGSLFSGGLSSPVTLAPRSARPSTSSELPPELMAAFSASPDADPNSRPMNIDIDLTVPVTATTAGESVEMTIDPTLGSSAEKPIELDLDMDIDMSMTDLFGDPAGDDDVSGVVDGLFSPSNTNSGKDGTKDGDALGMGILDALSAVGGVDGSGDVFPSLGESPRQNLPQSHSTDPSIPMTAPSPGSLLASFQSTAHTSDPLSSGGNVGSDTPFDLLLSSLSPGFFSHTTEPGAMSLDDLFNMTGVEPSTSDGGSNAAL